MAIDDNELTRLQRETNDALGQLALQLREAGESPAAEQNGSAAPADAQPLRDVSDALGRSTGAIELLTDGLGANAGALRNAAEAFTSGGQGLLGALTSGLSDGGGLGSILQGGFGLAPLAGALAGLFRGGGEREPEPAFEPVAPPPPIRLEGAVTSNGGLGAVIRGTGDEVRVMEPRSTAPQIVVNVSAMDSQSFMMRSHDIARAVRDAMLHMDPLNDVIGEL